jgi:predicted nucleic acid-binding protein
VAWHAVEYRPGITWNHGPAWRGICNRLMERAFSGSEQMHAPQLLDIEVTQVLRRLVRHKDIALSRAAQALEDLADLLIERHDHQPLVLSVYDGAYVALAEALAAPFLPCDAKLAGVHGHRATVELVTQ